jgi:putative PIN family toxin of toxin-antitoxin system
VRAVVDTGVLISVLIHPQGTTGEVLRALRNGRFTAIYFTDMLVEVIDMLGRDKFRVKYHLEPEHITILINLIRLRGELVIPQHKINACRDPQDDKFIEAALAGQADCVVSGDADLLDLTPFEDIPILRPAEFLARL